MLGVMRIITMFFKVFLIFALSFAAYADSSADESLHSWHQTQFDVASIIDIDKNFNASVNIFRNEGDIYNLYDEKIINGDAESDITNAAVIHIVGDLNANINQTDNSELVIGGNVSKKSTIRTSGISRIFIAGDLNGTIDSEASAVIVVKGSHNGTIITGAPSSKISIHGNLKGSILPKDEKGALLSIEVYGYTEGEVAENICGYPYTQIRAAFHLSDIKPGIYEPGRPHGGYCVFLR